MGLLQSAISTYVRTRENANNSKHLRLHAFLSAWTGRLFCGSCMLLLILLLPCYDELTHCNRAQLAGVYSLVSSHETTSAYYRPYHSALAILSVTGLVLLLATRLLPGIFAIAAVEETQSSLPLADVPKPHPSRMGQRQGSVGHLRYSRLQQRLVLAVLPGLICLRIEFARQIISNAQCAGPTYAMLLPFLIVAHDKLHRRNALARPATYARPTNPIVDMLYRTTQGSWSLILPAACLTYWSLTLVNATTVRSTYICAGSLRFHVLIPALQLVGTLLDFVIIILTASVILKDQRSHNFDSKITTRTIATVMLVIALPQPKM